ncbi:MAG TPA: ribose 5-phosphate isomerase B [Dehalococcoidia bacterium]|nr:ribose 5-phosphate isomerase B [Dehalococcoidia bacterium]
MRIGLGCDHAGFEYKESIRSYLAGRGYAVTDYGTHSAEAVDYPDQAAEVARAVAGGREDYGILICGTGIGMSIAANKIPGIRAGVCLTAEQAHLTREHNDANVLCLGARCLTIATALEIVDAFLAATFAAGRHERRVDKIRDLERTLSRVP